MPNSQSPPPPSQATPPVSTTPPRKAAGSVRPTLEGLIACISENISALVRGGTNLTKAEGQHIAKEMELRAGLLAAIGVLTLFVLGLMLGALTIRLSRVVPLWTAFLVVTLILTLIAVPMTLISIKRLETAKADTSMPQERSKEPISVVKGTVTSGLQKGNVR